MITGMLMFIGFSIWRQRIILKMCPQAQFRGFRRVLIM
jgi:hypothetical protein